MPSRPEWSDYASLRPLYCSRPLALLPSCPLALLPSCPLALLPQRLSHAAFRWRSLAAPCYTLHRPVGADFLPPSTSSPKRARGYRPHAQNAGPLSLLPISLRPSALRRPP